MNRETRLLVLGLALLAAFTVILVLMFLPLFGGRTALEYCDGLYNSISKGSAYYIPGVREEVEEIDGKVVGVTLHLTDATEAGQTAKLFSGAGAQAEASGAELEVTGDLAQILTSCLDDADAMYHNDADKVTGRYGYDERQALYNWWHALKEMDKELKKQKLFKEAKVATLVKKKAVETSYNYYGVEPQKIMDKLLIVIFSLIFYVVYTMWYGFGIMFIFEGIGLKLTH